MTWIKEMQNNIVEASQLKEYLKLDDEKMKKLKEILDRYPMSISQYYLSLCDFDDIENDPIIKMSIPSLEETDLTSGSFDTSGEKSNTIMRGLQHKYRETAMIVSSHECAMYCRHCFRKRLVGVDTNELATDFEKIRDYIQEHKEITNVLITGGDSFINSNSKIEKLLELFTKIEHLDFIRFGTRTPVVLPQRIYEDEELLEILKKYNKVKQIYVVTQFNHPKEITEEAVKSVKALNKCGIIVKNQTVLLRGINDNPNTLTELLRKFTENNIIPYYIFQCRPVTGVMNQFQVPLIKGYKIVQEAKNNQNGFGKHVTFGMSHVTGKIEIVGVTKDNRLLLKYHEAKKRENLGQIFTTKVTEDQAWLADNFEKELI